MTRTQFVIIKERRSSCQRTQYQQLNMEVSQWCFWGCFSYTKNGNLEVIEKKFKSSDSIVILDESVGQEFGSWRMGDLLTEQWPKAQHQG